MPMSMASYLNEMKDEVSATIERVWQRHLELESLVSTIERAQREMEYNYRRVDAIVNDPFIEDDDGIGTGLYWETYFGPDKEQHDATVKKRGVEAEITTKRIARANAAGALLQYAKQAISQRHGRNKGDAPLGHRQIAHQDLRDVIWEGRNQAEHWDEGTFSARVNAVFNALESSYPGRFADYTNMISKAFDIVDILGWRTWATFELDLLSLG